MDWIYRIKNDENEALKEIYQNCQKPFVSWLRKNYNKPNIDAIEIFQQSLLIMYDNVQTGKLTTLTSDISTYIIAIAKNKILESLRRDQKRRIGEFGYWNQLVDHQGMTDYEDLSQYEVLKDLISNLGGSCKKLLELFYYRELNVEEIMSQMNFSTRDTVKTKKYKCLKRLQNAYSRHKG